MSIKINDKEKIFPINFSPLVVESLLFNRLQLILEKIVYEEKMRLDKQQQFMNIKFDLKEERPEQNTMMKVIDKSISDQKHVMISAPTGTGKTAGAILPALKFAIAEGKKLFYCTSKNTQQEIVYQTLSPIKQSDTLITGLFLRATRKRLLGCILTCAIMLAICTKAHPLGRKKMYLECLKDQ